MTPAQYQPWPASYQHGVPAQIDVSAFTAMDELLHAAFERYASRDAYACCGEVISFDELDSQTRAVAPYLRGLGLPAGARVSLIVPTALAYPVVLLGILRSGHTAACINPQYTATELGHVLTGSGAEVLFLAPEIFGVRAATYLWMCSTTASHLRPNCMPAPRRANRRAHRACGEPVRRAWRGGAAGTLPGESTACGQHSVRSNDGRPAFSPLRLFWIARVHREWDEATARHSRALEGYDRLPAGGGLRPLSETSALVCCNPLDGRAQPGLIGLPVPGTEVIILGEQGRLAPGEVGEVAVRGPQVMSGYWNDAAATKAAIGTDDIFLTGDVGVMDEQGFVRIVERKKDVVIVGGFNVYPSEVESAVLTHGHVAEWACVGVPDANYGEAVKLFVVRKPGTEVTAHCRQTVTAFKLHRHIAFLHALPRTNVGKVSKPDLRSLHAREAA